MKKKLTIFLLFLLVTNANAQLTSSKTEKTEKNILEFVLETLKKEHIKPRKLDDVFSKSMFKTYIDTLDVDRLFFLQSDIEEFKKYETNLDDQIKNNDLSFLELSRKVYLQRKVESKEIYTALLKNKLNFSENNFWDSLKIKPFAKNKQELVNNWLRYLKFEIIGFCQNSNNSKVLLKDFEEIVQDFAENKMFNRVEGSTLNTEGVTSENVFVIYLNSFLQQHDVHTKYLSESNYQAFLMDKGGYSSTFGFNYNLKDDFATISGITENGPAWQTKKMNIGDVILKRAFDDDEPVSMVGKSLFDALKMVVKKKPTVIHYTLKKPDGSIYNVSLKRQKTFTSDHFIKSSVVEKNNIKYGVLNFSAFYKENLESDTSSSNDDMKNELNILKSEGVKGLIIDIRNNKGSNFEDTLQILSNFISNANVAQAKSKDNEIAILKTETNNLPWDLKTVLIINSATSGSAELIASVFKDQKLGIIIGENTFGNTSVTKTTNLENLKIDKENKNHFGYLKVRYKEFFDSNFKEIPKNGISPDIEITDLETKNRESNFSVSLSNKIKNKKKESNYFSNTIKKSKERLANNKVFKSLIKYQFNNEKSKIITLNLEQFKKQHDILLNKYENNLSENFRSDLKYQLTLNDDKMLKKYSNLLNLRQKWLETVKTDFQIDEGINILQDMLYMKQ